MLNYMFRLGLRGGCTYCFAWRSMSLCSGSNRTVNNVCCAVVIENFLRWCTPPSEALSTSSRSWSMGSGPRSQGRRSRTISAFMVFLCLNMAPTLLSGLMIVCTERGGVGHVEIAANNHILETNNAIFNF